MKQQCCECGELKEWDKIQDADSEWEGELYCDDCIMGWGAV